MKTMLKLFTAFFLAAAIVLWIAPLYENQLRGESSLHPKTYSKPVKRAMAKSIRWADDKQILRLVNKAEKKYGSHINLISRKYYACPKDIKAIAIVESSMNENAQSREGAIGLMGVKRTTARAMGFDDIEHSLNNLNAGTKYYTTLLKKFKDRELALAAYNLGPARVENRLSRGFDPETMEYIWKIRRVVHIIDKSES
ncbi:MAG: lytic transglycosylase domain-containing protein [Deltaproteobacteria bacterium]|nr:lytic transglycosylase domain-containing protein [Deltaproteobacteria bacterium]